MMKFFTKKNHPKQKHTRKQKKHRFHKNVSVEVTPLHTTHQKKINIAYFIKQIDDLIEKNKHNIFT